MDQKDQGDVPIVGCHKFVRALAISLCCNVHYPLCQILIVTLPPYLNIVRSYHEPSRNHASIGTQVFELRLIS